MKITRNHNTAIKNCAIAMLLSSLSLASLGHASILDNIENKINSFRKHSSESANQTQDSTTTTQDGSITDLSTTTRVLPERNAIMSFAAAVEAAEPAVVSIQTTKEIPVEMHPLMQDPFFRFFFNDPESLHNHNGGKKGGPVQKELQQGLGSGVIVDKRGYVLTNNHVIKDASSIIVKLPDGRESEATIVGSDSLTDLAVLKIKLDNLPVIKIGDADSLRVGDIVLAIGNPFGFERTVTQGIVSAKGSLRERTVDKSSLLPGLDKLIQTDAAINPGNSGGALITSNGELVGINMAIISRSGGSQGIGFAIPMDTAKNIMLQLIETGHISRGWLGVYLADLTEEISKYLEFDNKKQGAYVQGITRNSPAQKAGILPGDIIVKIDGHDVKDKVIASELIRGLQPNKLYAIDVFRKGEYLSLSVMISDWPKNLE